MPPSAASPPRRAPSSSRPRPSSGPVRTPQGPANDLATLAMLLGRLGRLNEVVSTEVCQAHGVTPAEVRLLATLREAGEPLRPSVLSDRIVQTSGGLTATLRRLEEDGRIRRFADPDDGRVRFVGLTSRGESFVDGILRELFARYDEVLDGLDVGDALLVVHELLARFEAATGSRPSGGWQYSTG